MDQSSRMRLKTGLADMLCGGVIMDVVNAEQAIIAEQAGACAVMALEKIQKSVTIPVMAKVRIGHFAEAQILAAMGVDFIDESEVLTPADEAFHVNKHDFEIPFVCGATNLGEALRRINEGAALIRSKGEAGTGNIVEAVRHLRSIHSDIEKSQEKTEYINRERIPLELLELVLENSKLPVPLFCAGGIATPADASLVMQLGAEAIFVGSGIFKSDDPAPRALAIVEATTHYKDADLLRKVSTNLGVPMVGITDPETKFENRGW